MTPAPETRPRRRRARWALVAALAVAGAATAALSAIAVGGSDKPMRPIAINQTDTYADGQVGALTYYQNYSCVHDPLKDLDGDGMPAAADPEEFQSADFQGPRCVVGKTSTLDPAGDPSGKTEPVYVIVPFFQAGDGDVVGGEDGAIAKYLDSQFGGLRPEAFDPTPDVPVQCPEPGLPNSKLTGEFGTCTMHPRLLDLDPALKALGAKTPSEVFGLDKTVPLPLVNHSHVIGNVNFKAVWWKVVVVLVTDQKAWPDVNGTKGITSVEKLRAAEKSGQAIPAEVPSNFYLFFDSREMAAHAAAGHVHAAMSKKARAAHMHRH